jgi:DNA-binding transcriptional regulator WhiA
VATWTDCVADTGANASAEEAEEGAEDSAEQVIDVVHSFRLNATGFDKKGYLTYLKGAYQVS